MTIRFAALASASVAALRAGRPDAHDQPPERRVSDGSGLPCRHCLRDVPEGRPVLLLAWRPFPEPQPYAETGPIFLCAEPCPRHPHAAALPPILAARASVLLRGYDARHRIVDGTGALVPTARLVDEAEARLARPGIAYLHLSSVSNGCYLARVERSTPG